MHRPSLSTITKRSRDPPRRSTDDGDVKDHEESSSDEDDSDDSSASSSAEEEEKRGRSRRTPPENGKRRKGSEDGGKEEEDVYVILLREEADHTSAYRIRTSLVDKALLGQFQERHAKIDQFEGSQEWNAWFRLYNTVLEDTDYEATEQGEPILLPRQRARGIFILYDPHGCDEEILQALSKVDRSTGDGTK